MQRLYAHWIKDRLKGKSVHVVASGPSLTDFDYCKLSGRHVIAVNHSYKCVPWALWTVAGDRAFIQKEDVAAPKSTTLLCRNEGVSGIVYFESISHFSANPHDGLYCKKLSGTLALMSAIHAGAERIYLWGHDCAVPEGHKPHATSGKFLHRMDERLKTDKGFKLKDAHDSFERRTKYYDRIAAEKLPCLIYNVEIPPVKSGVRCFPIVTPDEALKEGQ